MSDGERKQSHGQYRACAKRTKISNRFKPAGERECRQDTKKVRTAGKSVQGSNCNGGMSMSVRLWLLVFVSVPVRMNMRVHTRIISMGMHVHVELPHSAKTPKAYRDQGHPNKALSYGREHADRQHLP